MVVLCGGPSMERGISLNSCRSVCDNLESPDIEIQPVYFDYKKQAYAISRAALYSNTPSDFDFKLQNGARKLTKRTLLKLFRDADLVFPVMHGAFGEDGQIQAILEKSKARYIGSPSHACKIAFNKFKANELIRSHDFPSLPSAILKSHLSKKENLKALEQFFKMHRINRAVVKPVSGGSSIGVHSVTTPQQGLVAMQDIFSKKLDTQAVVEPFCEGKEFTVVILQNRFGLPVALIPSEIETSYQENQIFDFRKKYLPTRKVKYHCPPRFTQEQIEKIQTMAEQLFSVLGMRHFGRFDGWLLKDGKIWFSDFNPISGMEQNSFLFQQASQVGFTHRDVLMHILRRAAADYGLQLPKSMNAKNEDSASRKPLKKERINVLGGGVSAERQVSLMSATNVWLKLKRSPVYDAHLYIVTGDNELWHTPYNFSLNHTVEEIAAMLHDAERNAAWLERHRNEVLLKLALRPGEASETLFQPQKMTLKEFLKLDGFVFLGLHGGMGEDGTIQKLLTQHGKKYNGSHTEASRLCMDKFATGEAMKPLKKHGIYTAEKKVFPLSFFKTLNERSWPTFWTSLKKELGTQMKSADSLIIKPTDDGCSAGICRITTYKDLQLYLDYANRNALEIPAGVLKDQHGIIEMPSQKMQHIMFERFIETDKPRVVNNKLIWHKKTGWIEVTVGVLGHAKKIHALSPSLTVSHSHVLSLEEKFQGGTGVNITPPPQPYVAKKAVEQAKKRIEIAANALGIEGYARLDAFMHTQTGEIYIIEANTLPALTPSTVIFHQALEEKSPMYPREFLEYLIQLGKAAKS